MGVDIQIKNSWSVPVSNGRSLEFHRVVCHFEERRAGKESEVVQSVVLPLPPGGRNKLLHADAYISGFDTWYTREDSDCELMRLNIDAYVVEVYQMERTVELRLRFQLTDDAVDSDDFSEAWLGLMLIAHSE